MAKGVTFPRIGGIIGQAEWRSYVGLIETWDVLKFGESGDNCYVIED